MGLKPLYVQVDEDLLQKAKIHCVKNNLTLREFVEDLLRKELENGRVEVRKKK